MICVHTSPLARAGSGKVGGMNVYVRELSKELGRRGIQVDIYTRYAAPETPAIDSSLGPNVRVISLEAGPYAPIEPGSVFDHLDEFSDQLLAFAQQSGAEYDLVHSHYWLSGVVAHRLQMHWGTPFVHMFHTLGQMKNRITQKLPASASEPDTRITYENKVTLWANHLIAATRAEYSQLLWLYRADRRKIEIIPPGYDPVLFYPVNPVIARQSIGAINTPHLFVFVGRLEPLKAIDTILEAMTMIAQSQPDRFHDLELIVVGGNNSGSDPELERLKEITKTLHIASQVQFIGSQEHHRLRDLYAAASAVLMPSDYESFGMVALEAMASGTPVIASEVGGLAYLVRHGETGFLVPSREPAELASRMVDIMENPALRQRMSQAAIATAAQYTWSRIVDQMEFVFQRAIDTFPPTHHKSLEYP
jgi:D-inositol-3-phosphate glycosyltransferase